ncbi:hypothetical protein KP509_28G069700 [Ceratopteris richardii]|uniref:CASP-like protein n=1 Tax=Ceratopteris richardii TaxID=49495 RepID=A0A8T2REL6_CERRI|nr:hypothetical protein KP509_28G069700 [Ceratopteris richardii]
MNLSEPVRPQQFETSSFGQGPHRPQAFDTMSFEAPVRGPSAQGAHQTFDTMNLEAPVRRPSAAPQSNKPAGSKFEKGTEDPSGETPIHPKIPEQKRPLSVDGSTDMAPSLVIIALCLRVFEVLLLIIALSLIASYSKDFGDGTLSVSTFQSTKYALATTIIGVLYSIFEVVLVTVRLIAGHPLLPGKISSYVSYVGDQAKILNSSFERIRVPVNSFLCVSVCVCVCAGENESPMSCR